MVRKWRSSARRQVGDQKTAKALGSELPPMLLGRDKHRCLLAIEQNTFASALESRHADDRTEGIGSSFHRALIFVR
jgi:hypothetical protein